MARAKCSAVHHADDVPRPRLLHRRALPRQELLRRREAHHLPRAHVLHLHPRLELPGAHAHEGHAIAMLRVHVRLDLEHEPGERLVGGCHRPDGGLARRGRRRELQELAEERLHAEVRERAPEEHGSEPLGQHFFVAERMPRLVEEVDVVHELLVHGGA
jgi:hypothetical protein